MAKTLFPTHLPGPEWLNFNAEGFQLPVSGVIFRKGYLPCCGMPLGGISTGCIDLDVRGVYGFSTIFNPSSAFPFQDNWRMPRRAPDYQPMLGISVGGKTWVLTTSEIVQGGDIPYCRDPYFFTERMAKDIHIDPVCLPKIEDVQAVKEIHYWGHYPVADLEFETDAPISVGMRAWSPFIPGDTAASNIPAVVFRIHLRNTTCEAQSGTLAFNFPGPNMEEARAAEFSRQSIEEDFKGIMISASSGVNYSLGIIGNEEIRFGAGLNNSPEAWSQICEKLPQPSYHEALGRRIYHDPSSSLAVDFKLEPEEEKVVNILLTWFAPVWEGANNNLELLSDNIANTYQDRFRVRWMVSKWAGNTNYYTHMYAARYDSSRDIARRMAEEHSSLLDRILSWQAVIYQEVSLPIWLQDSLVNSLALIAEDGMWAQAKPPLGDWCYPEGVFALNESPRGCPDLSVTPCDWYGNFPIVFFFPELARTTLRQYKHCQKETGEIPIWLGKMGDLPDFVTPGYHWQVSLNSMCYVDLVYRLWRRTGDNSILKEFYDSVKKATTLTMNLRKGPEGVISMPEEGGMEWFEHGEWAGMATHMGGLRLAQLRITEHMAQATGDQEYIEQCQKWFADGAHAMEEDMWTGSYYLNFYEKDTGKKSDDVMAYQFDGQWLVDLHGLPSVFREDRIKRGLETIKRCNIALTPEIGAANFTRPDGSALVPASKVAFYGPFSMFPPEVLILAETYIYSGQKEFGLELAFKHWKNLVLKQRLPWDLPNLVRGDTGERIFGTDYSQDMLIWTLPIALAGETIQSASRPDGFIERVIRAGAQVLIAPGNNGSTVNGTGAA